MAEGSAAKQGITEEGNHSAGASFDFEQVDLADTVETPNSSQGEAKATYAGVVASGAPQGSSFKPANGDADAGTESSSVTANGAVEALVSPSSDAEVAKDNMVASRLAMLGVDDVGMPDFTDSDAAKTVFDEYAQEAIKDLEDVSQKISVFAKSAVTDAKNYLQVPRAATLGSLSSWWGGLTTATSAAPTDTAAASTTAGGGGGSTAAATPRKRSPGSLQQLFGLPDTENILESFTCCVLQTLDCTHNPYTRGLALPLPGVLCVTDVGTCFVGDDEAAVPPFKLPHAALKKAAKQRPPRAKKGEAAPPAQEPSLRLEAKDGSWVVVRGFGEAHGLDDALALIELKMEELAAG